MYFNEDNIVPIVLTNKGIKNTSHTWFICFIFIFTGTKRVSPGPLSNSSAESRLTAPAGLPCSHARSLLSDVASLSFGYSSKFVSQHYKSYYSEVMFYVNCIF